MHTASLPTTPWPVIWVRVLRSTHAVARRNAVAAARVLQERRVEREQAEGRPSTRGVEG